MWQLNEDEYWERYRERVEAPMCRGDDDPPELEEELLSIDEIADTLEAQYGPLETIGEYDLLDIVKAETGVEAVSAEFDRQLFCIFYRYEAA